MLRVSLLLLLVSVCVPGGYWIECQLLTQVDAQTIKAFEEWYKKENPKAQNLTLGTEYFQSRVGVFSLVDLEVVTVIVVNSQQSG
jgi:hypothetical protein